MRYRATPPDSFGESAEVIVQAAPGVRVQPDADGKRSVTFDLNIRLVRPGSFWTDPQIVGHASIPTLTVALPLDEAFRLHVWPLRLDPNDPTRFWTDFYAIPPDSADEIIDANSSIEALRLQVHGRILNESTVELTPGPLERVRITWPSLKKRLMQFPPPERAQVLGEVAPAHR